MSEDATLDDFRDSQSKKETNQNDGDEPREVRLGPRKVTIPASWKITELDKIGEIVTGDTPSTNDDEYFGDKYPFVTPEDLRGNGSVDTVRRGLSEKGMNETRPIPAGSVMMDCIGSDMGKVALAERKLATNQQINSVVPDNDLANSIYIKYQLQNISDIVRAQAGNTATPILNKGRFSKSQILLPPLVEQRKIATVLYNVDQAIQNTEEIVGQVDKIEKGLKDKLLTKGLGNTETAETRLGPVSTEIPVHWKKERIGELFVDRQLGTDERGSTEDGENIDLIKMGNVDFGTWDLSEIEKIEKDSQLLEEVGLQKGDLLFNTRNTPELVGKTAVWEFDREAVYDNNLLRLRFGERISSGHFVNAYFSSSIGRRQLRSRVHGTTSVAAIYWTDLQQIEIPLPPKKEQKQIVDILRRFDENRRFNQSYRGRLERLKKGLMQDLLTGTVRTTDTNIEVPEKIAQHG